MFGALAGRASCATCAVRSSMLVHSGRESAQLAQTRGAVRFASAIRDSLIFSAQYNSPMAFAITCLLAWKRDRSPPTVTPSRDAPARAIYASTEYSLMRRLDGM